MIKVIESRPHQFDHLSDHNTWMMGYDIDGVYSYYALEVANGMGAIHLELLKWSHNIAKRLKSDLEVLKIIARNKGANCLIASFPNTEDAVWPKFIKRFGFPDPTKVYLSKMEI